jgi:chromosome segregation ATPase
MVRRFVGIEDLLAESAQWNKELSKQSASIAQFDQSLGALRRTVEHTNAQVLDLRAKIEGGKVQPASAAFIDAIFKENRDRLDMVIVTLDSFAEKMRRTLQ